MATTRTFLLFTLLCVFIYDTFGLPAKTDEIIAKGSASITRVPIDEVAVEDGSRKEAVVEEADDGAAEESSNEESIFDTELMSGDEADEEDDGEEQGDSSSDGQHLFPSFSSLFSTPLGHSRPTNSFYQEPLRSFQTDTFHRSLYGNDDSDRVLGSGNFGVIRGGTYYSGAASDEPFTRNSHSRPYRRPNPLPQFKHGGDFFSGFRDFADITTPPKPAYSQIVIVYANKNQTASAGNEQPKNIQELIEREMAKSKTKKKLALYKEQTLAKESSKKFRSKELEPLLALS